MSPHRFYLFLDFDGVLHHGDNARPFEQAARLGELLAGYPEVQVVINSSWRAHHAFDALRTLCWPQLGRLLVGVTPSILVKRVIDEDPPYSRLPEIASWLAGERAQTCGLIEMTTAALGRDDWLAIDDTDSFFPPGCRQLLRVSGGTGMHDQHFAELEARLRTFRREIPHVT